MKEKIKETEIKKFHRCGIVFSILLVATIVSAVPLTVWIGIYAVIPWGVLCVTMLFFAYKTEQIKKDNNIYTYREIVAFMDGKRLDEIEQQQEKGKRPYQRFLLCLCCALLALIICLIMMWFLLP